MLIELTKKQIETALDDYINESMSTEDFGAFIQKLIRRYSSWDGADTNELLKKFVKATPKNKKPCCSDAVSDSF